MDVAALILAIAAIVACFTRPAFGLPLFIAAVVCQWVHLTGHLVHVN